ncbi:hypothetical protein [Bacteroidetes bacterium endosymbiont of Geopemphigus sp.]|uniref:hypothetical protein n=1 Tax=Bacteroidetes bacterium endosymbiont of Geopemphigus sp. TaxID=2047937 RepID=UPI0018A852C5|nr:hypothetical protein [Bacteroidetes bacterium endosymbiont of Geopemphigus sp.]
MRKPSEQTTKSSAHTRWGFLYNQTRSVSSNISSQPFIAYELAASLGKYIKLWTPTLQYLCKTQCFFKTIALSVKKFKKHTQPGSIPESVVIQKRSGKNFSEFFSAQTQRKPSQQISCLIYG